MIPGWLDGIITRKREELSRAKRDLPLARLKQRISGWHDTRDLARSLREKSGIIAGFKRATPYQGVLRPEADCAAFARDVEQGGASAVAVATEESFGGRLDDLEKVRHAVALPLLRLDVLWDEYQVYESRLWGADAVWLIAGLLPPARLKALREAACSLRLSPLVEVRDRKETVKALKAGADILALNLRQPGTSKLNKEMALKWAPAIPKGVLKIVAGGIASRREIEAYRKAGFDGFIVGEHLMRSKSPAEALRKLWSE